MTQNLDYDLPTGNDNVTIAAANTDLTTDQANLTVTGYTNTTGVGEWKSDTDGNTALRYYNPGLYVYTTPTEINSCGFVSDLSKCTSYGWKEYAPGDDEHYLAGNYYSFAAATAGTGNSITSGDASGSICPKGWKLPLSGPDNNTTSGSFYYLLNSYGYEFTNGVSGLVGSTGQNITSSPLYFLRGGYIYTASLGSAGIENNLWSRMAISGANAYRLLLNHTHVYLFSPASRSAGYPIRCLADRES